MRWQIGLPGLVFALILGGTGLFVGLRSHPEAVHSSAPERLQPVGTVPGPLVPGGTVYVPVYSSLHLGRDIKQAMVELAVTVSVRNVSVEHPIVIEWVRYFDSTGKRVRDYLEKPSALPALGSVEFVVQRSDTTGGPGANFLIHWNGPAGVEEPIIEAVMLGQAGNAGISFTSPGRVVKSGRGIQ